MSSIARFLSSSIGRKVLMALTGLFLILFLVAHLAGNLLIFAGAEPFNQYSHALLSTALIYIAEAGLLVLFIAHFVAGIMVYISSWAARPEPYRQKRWARSTSNKSVASATMIFSGIMVLVFVPLHVWTFKFGAYYMAAGEAGMRDLHRLVLEVFQKPGYVAGYVIAMAVLGFHLWHAFGSALESLGVHYRKSLRRFGEALAVVLAAGFLLIPVVVYLMGDQL